MTDQQPPARPHDSEIAAYASGRWPVVVRMLVLLGAPPRHAATLATEALAGLFGRFAGDEWVDLDAALAAEVVDAWERDRTLWWRRPEVRTDHELTSREVREALGVLDALEPAERARLVLGAAAGLTPDQLDDALGPGAPMRLGSLWNDDLARVAQAIPVGEARVEAARTRWDDRRRETRSTTITSLVAALVTLAVLGTVALQALDPRPDPGAAAPAEPPPVAVDPTSTSDTDGVSRSADLLPVTWYDGRRVHLADRTVRVPRVRSMVRVDDGVVATDERGRVLHVRSGGTVGTLGRTVAGAEAVADPVSGLVSWVDDETGELVVQPLRAQPSPTSLDDVPLEAGARVVATDRRQVFVDQPDGAVRVRADDLVTTRARRGLVDVAAGTKVRQLLRNQVVVEVGRATKILFDGSGGWLSDDGRYLLTRDVGTAARPLRVVIDLESRTLVPFTLPAGAVVADAAFDGAGHVTFVLVRPNGTEYPADWPRDEDYAPGFDLVVCDLAEVACQRDELLFVTGVQPLLAR